MTYQPTTIKDDPTNLPKLPTWVTSGRAETLETVAFMSGAALATLHVVSGRLDVPLALWRDRLALQSAEACVKFSGRSERANELRDEVHLLRPGDRLGPAGEIYQAWRRATERPCSVKALQRALPTLSPEQIATWLDAGSGTAIARAAHVLRIVYSDIPREESSALILADAVLARGMGWDHIVPLLSVGLKRRDLHKSDDDLRMACHKAVLATAGEAVRMATDLTRRANRLTAVAPKLRAKGAGRAVEIFLSRDAVLPAALPLSDRAARRLCDRLLELGAVRELTGRETFRLYGL